MFRVLQLFVAIAWLLPGAAAAAEKAPHNVVLIYADDLGFGYVACNGGRVPVTSA